MTKKQKRRFKYFKGIISDETLMKGVSKKKGNKSEEDKEFEKLLKMVVKDSKKSLKASKKSKSKVDNSDYIYDYIDVNFEEEIDKLVEEYGK